MRIELTATFRKKLKKLDNQIAIKILDELAVIEKLEDPRAKGKALTGNLKGLWRYRVGDYRVICRIQDTELVIIAVEVGHRREIYTN